MSRDEKISVIIPAYNSAGYLSEAIESVLQQTVPPQEIIVIDDGSTDDTESVAKQFKNKVHYVYQEHAGVAVARNKGLQKSKGDLITFIDADDIWLKDKIELQLHLFQQNPEAEMIIGFLQRVYGKCNEGSLKVFDKDESGIFVLSLGSTLIRKDVFEKVGNFDEELALSEDLDWFLRAREAEIRVDVHEEVVQLYRQHEDNTTKDKLATNHYMLRAIKKSLDRRRGFGGDFSLALPSFKNLDQIIEFWMKNNEVPS